MANEGMSNSELHALSKGERALMHAQGKAIALLSSLLANRGLLDRNEFGAVLDLFSCVVAENDVLEADILSSWVRDIEEVPRSLMAPSVQNDSP